jgi:hypothetical protein
MNGLRPEIELLICCARLRLSEAERNRVVQLLGSGLDWSYLIKMASWHSLMPLLYRHLNALAVPREIAARLWAFHESNGRRNRIMAQALLEILGTLDLAGIPAVAYKGPGLAAAVYGDLALRQFGDLDLLLRPQDILRAKELLQNQGCIAEYDLNPSVETAFLHSHLNYHLVLIRVVDRVVVELHWKTDADFPVERDNDTPWWRNLETTRLGDKEIRCFKTEELLLILLVHGSKHAWESLGWLVDVAELVRQHPNLDWDWIMAKAERLGCQRRVGVGLVLADEVLAVSLPERIKSKVRGISEVQILAREIFSALFDTRHEAESIKRLRLNMRLYDRTWQSIRYCSSVLLAPTLVEWARWPLPRCLHFMYLPLRLGRLVGKYGARLVDRYSSQT